jgi:glycerophosphoryl diester phosphodiesterase
MSDAELNKFEICAVAHRGYAAKYPENTIRALQEAINVGATMVEFDVQITSEGLPLMIHDDNFKRTTGIDKSVFETTQGDLKSISELESISSVREVMVWVKANEGVTAFVELKQESINHHGLEKCMAYLSKACLSAIDSCVFISFNAAAVALAKGVGFKEIGWVVLNYDEKGEGLSRALSPEYLFADKDMLPVDGSRLWKGGWTWVIYEVVSKELARELYNRGARCIESKEIEHMISSHD